MKKTFGIVSCIVGILLILAGAAWKRNPVPFFIIGGADGPTSVFVAGKLTRVPASLLIVTGIVLLTAAIIFYWKNR